MINSKPWKPFALMPLNKFDALIPLISTALSVTPVHVTPPSDDLANQENLRLSSVRLLSS
jgi:hypothetical protein